MRPVPLPSRCARKFAVKLPVICVSPDEIGSLLVIVVILHTGFGVQLSDAETDTVTGTSLLFGGQITFGDADTEAIVGGCWSTTVTLPLQEAERFCVSVTVSFTPLVPKG